MIDNSHSKQANQGVEQMMKNDVSILEPSKSTRVEQTTTLRGRPRFKLPPQPTFETGEKVQVSFPISKNSWGQIPQDSAEKLNNIKIFFLYVDLNRWPARQLGDRNNPRSHSESCLRTPIAKAIHETLTERPETFFAVNRGITVLAENCQIKNGIATITINGKNTNQGICDGATTDSVISQCQVQFQQKLENNKKLPPEEQVEIDNFLERGKVRVEVIIGANDHDFIANLVEARNRSVLLKQFSLENFRGTFDWLKDILESSESPFTGKIAYDENQAGFPILDVLSILTLFHRQWDEQDDVAPVIAYAAKGKLSERLSRPEFLPGYKALSPIVIDILSLYEYAYANFGAYYDAINEDKAARLGRRRGFESRLGANDKPYILPLTQLPSDYIIDRGILYPFVAALRCLVKYTRAGDAAWRRNPKDFLNEHGPKLVKHLIGQLSAHGGSPNQLGKEAMVYISMYSKALLASQKKEEQE